MIRQIFRLCGWGTEITPRQARLLPESARFKVGGTYLTSPKNAEIAVSEEIDLEVLISDN